MASLRFAAIFMAVLVASMPITFAGTLSLTYDANGNLVTGDGLYREYNSLNQLSTVRNGSNATEPILQEFVYHPTEERILLKRTYNSTNSLVERVIYLDENFVRVINTSGTYDFTYVKHEGQLVAQINPDRSKYYIHGDHLGSSSVVTNQQGAAIENTTYSPFGEVVSGGNLSRFDYEGKEYDSLVGDYDFHFRKYCAKFGIFCQPDTLIQNVYDPQSLNRYSFERNNPYRFIDQDGHFRTDLFLQGVVGVGLGIASVATMATVGIILGIPAVAVGIVYVVGGIMFDEEDDEIAEDLQTAGNIVGGGPVSALPAAGALVLGASPETAGHVGAIATGAAQVGSGIGALSSTSKFLKAEGAISATSGLIQGGKSLSTLYSASSSQTQQANLCTAPVSSASNVNQQQTAQQQQKNPSFVEKIKGLISSLFGKSEKKGEKK